jgi:hypothetical protein
MFVDGKWKAERLLLSTDWSHTAEDVIFTYSLRWTIEPMFAALKWSEGMIDMWMVDPKGSGSKTFHRWLNMVQIGPDPDAGRQGRSARPGLAQGAVSHRRHGQSSEPSGILRRQKHGTAEGGNSTLPDAFR